MGRKNLQWVWGCKLVPEHLPITHKDLSSIPNTKKPQTNKNHRTTVATFGQDIRKREYGGLGISLLYLSYWKNW
jgi:hypothetical protein